LKKLVSIMLLAIFILYTAGYYLLLWGLQFHARSVMSERIEAGQYNTEETVIIKIPLTIPYNTISTGYQRAEGSFEYHEELYKLVQQKVADDTLYTVCIRDKHEQKIHNTLTDFVKLSNDLHTTSKQKIKLSGFFLKDFTPALSIDLQKPGYTPRDYTHGAIPDLVGNVMAIQVPPPDYAV